VFLQEKDKVVKREKTGKSRAQSETKLGTTIRQYEDGVEKLQWFKLTDPQVGIHDTPHHITPHHIKQTNTVTESYMAALCWRREHG
jgi:hypothetical protein